MSRPKVVNLYAGPGTGKSTTMAALFAELKYRGHNVEMATEFAKEATWEQRGEKVFKAQEYIFGKQHFRLWRVAHEVDIVVTDSPLLLSLVYGRGDTLSRFPSLHATVIEAYHNYSNLDVFLRRSPAKAYNPKGRNQDEAEANELDKLIYLAVNDHATADGYLELTFDRSNVGSIIERMEQLQWIKP